jgi:biotin-(acetyl-CoA carboxylase) ligase
MSGIAERYAALRVGESPVKEWEAALDTIGKMVVVELPDERLESVAVGVDQDGALLVRAADGGVHRVVAGDVRVRSVPAR